MTGGIEALSEKEKQTLRLLLLGHDAKSMARHFDLSVHTINERLREARRKLGVSSSKHAARLLCAAEGATPEMLRDGPLAGAAAVMGAQVSPGHPPVPRSARRPAWVTGVAAMTLLAATLMLLTTPSHPLDPTASDGAVTESSASAAARRWLALNDTGRWAASYAAMGDAFRSINTEAAWAAASEKARTPLGRVQSRTLLSDVDTPAPPNGYRVLRFRTDFERRRGAIETVSLERIGGEWKVVGVYIE